MTCITHEAQNIVCFTTNEVTRDLYRWIPIKYFSWIHSFQLSRKQVQTISFNEGFHLFVPPVHDWVHCPQLCHSPYEPPDPHCCSSAL